MFHNVSFIFFLGEKGSIIFRSSGPPLSYMVDLHMLTYNGEIVLFKAVLSAMTIYNMFSLYGFAAMGLLVSTKSLERYFCVDLKKPRAAIPMVCEQVCRLTEFGGVSIHNLQLLIHALRA